LINPEALIQEAQMCHYLIVSIGSGLFIMLLDTAMPTNKIHMLGCRQAENYNRILKNLSNGWATYLLYGFVVTNIFFCFNEKLPGMSGIMKGLSFGLGIWFLRVAFVAPFQRINRNINISKLYYDLMSGLGKMLIIGLFYGLFWLK
jgi:hypothetical protein